jgi:hypothetical protein
MSNLGRNAVAYLQKRFYGSGAFSKWFNLTEINGTEVLKFWVIIVHDFKAGTKHRAVAIECLKNEDQLKLITQKLPEVYNELDAAIFLEMGNDVNPTGHSVSTKQMNFSPKIILYTDTNSIPMPNVLKLFELIDALVEVVDQSQIHKTLFISYGGPDECTVTAINKKLKSKGVKTWFFPDDALPGEKLHRMMHNGVNNHDRVLLVCSKNSLTRHGVLNEIERVLEREAREGGIEILIPITLDNFVYGDWAPERKDISDQVKSRVITKFSADNEESLDKLITVLKK